MKLVMTASISSIYHLHTWQKPINPILGETFEAELADESKIYVE